MENIERELQSYRQRKKRQEKIRQFKEAIKSFLMLGVKDKNENERPDITTVIHDSDNDEDVLQQQNGGSDVEHRNDSDGIVLSSEDDTVQNAVPKNLLEQEDCILKYTLRIVYIAFWITLYIIAIELQFGIVFLMVSALAAIYLNTRTGPKQRNEISAYSVFNKNCESIDGTLKAEQFEREIGIR